MSRKGRPTDLHGMTTMTIMMKTMMMMMMRDAHGMLHGLFGDVCVFGRWRAEKRPGDTGNITDRREMNGRLRERPKMK